MNKDRRAGIPFILITVFLDMLGIGLVIPVLPSLVGTLTTSRELQSYWYSALWGVQTAEIAPEQAG